MESKPVIILGGGLWGSLLAYRLKTTLPHIPFKLYERTSSLGGQETYSFYGSDINQSAMLWLRPFISKSWEAHKVRFPKFEKKMDNSFHLINPDQIHSIVSSTLPPDVLCLNNEMSARFALDEGSFVIDTRNICGYKKCGYQKFLTLELELEEPHDINEPILMDSTISQRDKFRCLHYIPLSENKVLIKDLRYSANKELNLPEMKHDLMKVIEFYDWKIKRVIREETGCCAMPISSPSFRQEGRVINLAGIFHDTTGCSIPTATRLIDKMVATSFRLGELKQVVSDFRNDLEGDRKFFRFINKSFIDSAADQNFFYQDIYQLPRPLIERFLRGRLSFIDRSRILFGRMTYVRNFSSLN
ncbi:lycopene cyclase family protein [Peredibacter starrii]|uniref:Lycopene cyclase family protein n=1 Tax=Peredibacter starrii TaxID=28202 RepID=A0AAX4HP95_9BACT|nr:lycopene cyclase family protein [Peredibacter starrii]WPU65136.1 lycopene cyclase family protein [Peredibacter starrii]